MAVTPTHKQCRTRPNRLNHGSFGNSLTAYNYGIVVVKP